MAAFCEQLKNTTKHDKIKELEKSRDSYTPPGFTDELSNTGEVTDGIWRNQASN